VVYVAFASYADTDPYHGWILGFSASNLGRTVAFNTTPNGQRGGIWSGAALASDGTFLYTAIGNGTWDGGPDWGDSYVKLSPGGGTLSGADFFTPFNQTTLNTNDIDLGSGMATLLPPFAGKFPHIMIGAGKEGRIYVVSRDNMGHFNSACDCQIVQSIPNAVGVSTAGNRNFSNPAYWNGNVYFSGIKDSLKRFRLDTLTGLLTTKPSD